MADAAAAAAAAAAAEGLTRHDVESANAKGKVPVYASANKSEMGVLVLQEWWGVNEQIKKRALDIAKEGFRVFVPDLYRGVVTDKQEHAAHLLTGLDWPGAIQDITAAAKFARSQGVSKVGVVGYCMGGALSLATAVLVEEVDAAVVYYGTPSPQLADPAKLRKPVQLHFGDKDTYDFASPKTVNALEAKLRDAKATFELYRYAETGHAFANEFRPEVYHAPSHKLSQQRMIDFFKRFLRK